MPALALCLVVSYQAGNPGPPWRDRFRWMYGASHPGLGQGLGQGLSGLTTLQLDSIGISLISRFKQVVPVDGFEGFAEDMVVINYVEA